MQKEKAEEKEGRRQLADTCRRLSVFHFLSSIF